MPSLDSLNTLKSLKVGDQTYHYFSLTEAARQLGATVPCAPQYLRCEPHGAKGLLHSTGLGA